jgi:adenylate cyclase
MQTNDLATWILSETTMRDDPRGLLQGVLDRLIELGVPIWRLSLGISTIDPQFRGMSLTVWRDRPPSVDASFNDAEGEAAFQQSPIFHAQRSGVLQARWNLDDPAALELPLLRSLREEGGTDYVLRLVQFGDQREGPNGAAFSFATKRPGGFEEAHIAMFDALLPALGIAAKCFSIARTAHEALSVYLGPRTGQRVLAGEIRRGTGQKISAAVLIADLRGFTTLMDREEAMRVVRWLDEHFELIGAAIDQHEGEVLKFLGDGLLAIFPFTTEPDSGAQACDRALAAAEQALRETRRLNADRQARGEPWLDLDIVLHAGEVVYGNVGAARRLDFTVIGSAVNEAARMEGICQSLAHNLLISDAFAAFCSCPTVPIGRVELRGISGERVIRTPAPH